MTQPVLLAALETHELTESQRHPGSNLRRGAAAFGWSIPVVAVSWFLLDRPISEWVRQADAALKSPAELLTKTVDSAWPLTACGLMFLLAAACNRKNLARWMFMLIASIVVSGLAANVLKIVVARARPKLLGDGVWGFHWWEVGYDYASFPSGHATTAGSLAIGLALMFPRWRFPIVVVGLLAAMSRVVLNSHYFGDVVAGWTLGCLTALAVDWVWWRRWPHLLPQPYARRTMLQPAPTP